MDEEKVACFMATFGISEEEARQMIADDEAIDHGANPFPLTAEQEKASKEARSTGTIVYTFTKRERKPDEDKRELISLFDELLADVSDGKITITNPERQIDFVYNDRNFRIVLSAPRKG
jgi:cytochrome P450